MIRITKNLKTDLCEHLSSFMSYSNELEVVADNRSLYIYKDHELKFERKIDHMRSILWQNARDELVILINHGNSIKSYIVDKSTFHLEMDTMIQVGYVIGSFYMLWSLSVVILSDDTKGVLNLYNVGKRTDIGYITVDTENSKVYLLHDDSFQIVVTSWDKKSLTYSRFLNHYRFGQSGEINLEQSSSLPVGYHTYAIIRDSADTKLRNLYCIVMTTLAGDKSLVYFMIDGASVPFKTKTIVHNSNDPEEQREWLDGTEKCLLLQRSAELHSVPFFGVASKILGPSVP